MKSQKLNYKKRKFPIGKKGLGAILVLGASYFLLKGCIDTLLNKGTNPVPDDPVGYAEVVLSDKIIPAEDNTSFEEYFSKFLRANREIEHLLRIGPYNGAIYADRSLGSNPLVKVLDTDRDGKAEYLTEHPNGGLQEKISKPITSTIYCE
ncbi:MAG: hypothetical protein KKG60_03475 [Nanoarchaeota archaeon]|nr:hypothetical protein [Nanoarchaeota archaeon]